MSRVVSFTVRTPRRSFTFLYIGRASEPNQGYVLETDGLGYPKYEHSTETSITSGVEVLASNLPERLITLNFQLPYSGGHGVEFENMLADIYTNQGGVIFEASYEDGALWTADCRLSEVDFELGRTTNQGSIQLLASDPYYYRSQDVRISNWEASYNNVSAGSVHSWETLLEPQTSSTDSTLMPSPFNMMVKLNHSQASMPNTAFSTIEVTVHDSHGSYRGLRIPGGYQYGNDLAFQIDMLSRDIRYGFYPPNSRSPSTMVRPGFERDRLVTSGPAVPFFPPTAPNELTVSVKRIISPAAGTSLAAPSANLSAQVTDFSYRPRKLAL